MTTFINKEEVAEVGFQLHIATNRITSLLQMATDRALSLEAKPTINEQADIFALDYAIRKVCDDIKAQADALAR